jgi:hypothetical protein
MRGAADVAAPAGDAGPSSSSKRSKASSTDIYGTPQPCADAAVEELIMGVHNLPSRKTLSTTHIDRVFDQCRKDVFTQQFGDVVLHPGAPHPEDDTFGMGELLVLRTPFALITDGWRKKAAGQGVPLNNVMVQPCTGSAHPVFVKAGGWVDLLPQEVAQEGVEAGAEDDDE